MTDVLAACGVFLYFPDCVYAAAVLRAMVRAARHGVLILDVPDRARQAAALAARRGALGAAAYARRYRGLDHLYYDRAWMRRTLLDAGASRVRIERQRISGYANAAFRFNAFAWK